MICVNKVWKLIGNNYDVTGNPRNEDILEFWSWYGKLNFTEINSYPH